MERVEGVEPSSLAWEARVMPLYDTRYADAGGEFYISASSIRASLRLRGRLTSHVDVTKKSELAGRRLITAAATTPITTAVTTTFAAAVAQSIGTAID